MNTLLSGRRRGNPFRTVVGEPMQWLMAFVMYPGCTNGSD